jgi:hypothetical protein
VKRLQLGEQRWMRLQRCVLLVLLCRGNEHG